MAIEPSFCVLGLYGHGESKETLPGCQPAMRSALALLPPLVSERLLIRGLRAGRAGAHAVIGVASVDGQTHASGFRVRLPLYSRLLRVARAVATGRPPGVRRRWLEEAMAAGRKVASDRRVACVALHPALAWLETVAPTRPGWPGWSLSRAVVEAATLATVWNRIAGRATRGPTIGLAGEWTASLEAFALACVCRARFVVVAATPRATAVALQRSIARETGISALVPRNGEEAAHALDDCDAVVAVPPHPRWMGQRGPALRGRSQSWAFPADSWGEWLGQRRNHGNVAWLPSPNHVVAAMIGGIGVAELGSGHVVSRLLFRSGETDRGEQEEVGFSPWEAAAPLVALRLRSGDTRGLKVSSDGVLEPIAAPSALLALEDALRKYGVVVRADHTRIGCWPSCRPRPAVKRSLPCPRPRLY